MSDQPFLRVVRGNPTPEQIAALVTALTARAAPPPPERHRSAWADPSWQMRRPQGPSGWRSTIRP